MFMSLYMHISVNTDLSTQTVSEMETHTLKGASEMYLDAKIHEPYEYTKAGYVLEVVCSLSIARHIIA